MKKLILLAIVCLFLSMFVGCAGRGSLIPGCFWADVTAPIYAGGGQPVGVREGRAQAKSILGVVALGDASIKAAANAAEGGPITQITSVDYHVMNRLGFFAVYTVIVRGK